MNDERWKDGIEKGHEDHEKRISTLERFQSWVLGAATSVGVVVGVFAERIAHALGLKP